MQRIGAKLSRAKNNSQKFKLQASGLVVAAASTRCTLSLRRFHKVHCVDKASNFPLISPLKTTNIIMRAILTDYHVRSAQIRFAKIKKKIPIWNVTYLDLAIVSSAVIVVKSFFYVDLNTISSHNETVFRIFYRPTPILTNLWTGNLCQEQKIVATYCLSHHYCATYLLFFQLAHEFTINGNWLERRCQTNF